MNSNYWIAETVRQLPRGAFLMVNGNPMTIGWAQFGVLWGKPCCTIYVRHSRYTHVLLETTETFTMSVPRFGDMQKELAYCGSHSGKAVNKCEQIKKGLIAPRFGAQAGLEGCRYQIECKILHRSELDESAILDPFLIQRYYADGDPHSMYIGEILGVTDLDEKQ